MITLDVWLYGELANYAKDHKEPGYANVKISLPENSTIQTLLGQLKIPSKERGITFINGNLSAMPGVQPDLDHILHDGDRVAFFHLRSMWPFQYRSGIAMTNEMSSSLSEREDSGLQHTYKTDEKEE